MSIKKVQAEIAIESERCVLCCNLYDSYKNHFCKARDEAIATRDGLLSPIGLYLHTTKLPLKSDLVPEHHVFQCNRRRKIKI